MTIYSIGHSNAEMGSFLALLERHLIDTLVDTRSQPYSRYTPRFNREALKRSLSKANVEYVYLGDLIGGRPEGPEYYFGNGKVDYDLLATAPFYLSGIEQLLELAGTARVAFMCTEADFTKCHRYWLITRTLLSRDVEVRHILHSGELASSELSEFEAPQLSLF